MRVEFSKPFQNIEHFIKDVMPKRVEEIYYAYCKNDASKYIKKFQQNLKNDHFSSEPLQDISVQNKSKKGYTQPKTPLYGAGKNEKNSYYNMFLLRKIEKGYKVYPRWAKHHDGDISLRDLLKIHEYGATIIVSDKMRNYLHYIGIHLKKETWVIKIPPRPVAFLTYRQILNERRNKSRSKELRSAINNSMRTGNIEALKKIREREILLSDKTAEI